MEVSELFINYIKYEKKFSEHTVREYSTDLKLFSEYLECSTNGTINLLTVRAKDIRGWLLSLLNKKESKTTIHRRISTLKSFYKYHIKCGNISKNPTQQVLLPKKTVRNPSFLEEKQINNLFEDVEFPDTFEGMRDREIIMLFYLTGIRRAELISLKKEDFDPVRNNIKVTGKRNKQRILPLPFWYSKHFEEFIKNMEEYFAANTENQIETKNDYIFVTKKGKQIYERLVYSVVRKYLTQVTTMLKRSPHTLRHTFATHLLNAGADLNAIKELLGHTSLAATQVYTHNSFEKLKKTYKQTHPRS